MGSRSPIGRGNFDGEGHAPTCQTTLWCAPCTMAEPIEMLFGLWTLVGPCIRWGPDPPCKGAIIGERTCPGMPDDILPWAVHKWLNWSICHLGCGLGWAKGRTSSIAFSKLPSLWRAHWRNLVNMIEPFVCSGDVASCQITLTTHYYYYCCL